MEIVNEWSYTPPTSREVEISGITPGNTLLAAFAFTDGRTFVTSRAPALNGQNFELCAGQSSGHDTLPATALYRLVADSSGGTLLTYPEVALIWIRMHLFEVVGIGAQLGSQTSPTTGFTGPTDIALTIPASIPSVGFALSMRRASLTWGGWSEGFDDLIPNTVNSELNGYALQYKYAEGNQTATGSISGGYLGVSFAVFEDVASERQRSRLILTPW